MPQRKRIGVVTACPEGDYQQRVLSGIFFQANLYNYDVFVFTPLSHTSAQSKDHVKGELNIYSLINFDLLDAVIITPIPLQEESNNSIVNMLLERFKNECHVPVVSIDIPFGDYPVVRTDEKEPFVQITDHLIEVHNCKNIAVLNGPASFEGSQIRLAGIVESMEKHGLHLDESQIYEGDFWYTSAEALGQRYLDNELPLPDAVVCTSDYMAIGLTNTLIKGGIKVPEQVIITGFDGTAEASLNNPPLTSYQPHTFKTAVNAVNVLHKELEPKAKEVLKKAPNDNYICIGSTCGCPEDESYTRSRIRKNQYMLQQNFNDKKIWKGIGIGTLFESYTNEILTGTSSTAECLLKIYESKYLIQPYEYVYFCFNQNWIDPDQDFEDGYSPMMNMGIFADRLKQFPGDENHIFYGPGHEKLFPVSQMLPDFALKTKFSSPQVFYFVPVHFNTISLGYCVLQNNLTEDYIPALVFRNYIRMINNALEMTRTRNKIISISEHDIMTNLLNRRGLNHSLSVMNARAKKGDKWLAIVADMDGLKFLNDNFGHSRGDEGLSFIANTMRSITEMEEVCVRNGGDEFLIAGLGHYTPKEIETRIQKFNTAVDEFNKDSSVPYSASIGYHITDWGPADAFDKAAEQADINMYLDKRKKKQRR
ncbi:MAG: GGDEF domain-containing protein [Treponema sp.]|nr:GGDEF domain-containing protein [Treponema sp.]